MHDLVSLTKRRNAELETRSMGSYLLLFLKNLLGAESLDKVELRAHVGDIFGPNPVETGRDESARAAQRSGVQYQDVNGDVLSRETRPQSSRVFETADVAHTNYELCLRELGSQLRSGLFESAAAAARDDDSRSIGFGV